MTYTLIPEDGQLGKLKRFTRAIKSTYRRSWTIKIIKSPYFPVILTLSVLFFSMFLLYFARVAETYWLKNIVISAVEIKHAHAKEITLEDYICTKKWDCKTAVAIAKAESGLRCDAQNVNKGTNSLDLGIMQINSVHLKKGWKVADLLNCHKNVDLAFEIYQGSGWGAWSTFTNKSYLKYK